MEKEAPKGEQASTAEIMNKSADEFSKGMIEMLKPIVVETDNRVKAVFEAQSLLQEEIQRFSRELDTFSDQSQTPSLGIYINKLAQTKIRMDNIANILLQVRERLLRLETQYMKP